MLFGRNNLNTCTALHPQGFNRLPLPLRARRRVPSGPTCVPKFQEPIFSPTFTTRVFAFTIRSADATPMPRGPSTAGGPHQLGGVFRQVGRLIIERPREKARLIKEGQRCQQWACWTRNCPFHLHTPCAPIQFLAQFMHPQMPEKLTIIRIAAHGHHRLQCVGEPGRPVQPQAAKPRIRVLCSFHWSYFALPGIERAVNFLFFRRKAAQATEMRVCTFSAPNWAPRKIRPRAATRLLPILRICAEPCRPHPNLVVLDGKPFGWVGGNNMRNPLLHAL